MKKGTIKTVLKHAGSLLILLSIVIVIPVLVSLIYAEWYSAIGFLISAIITLTIGFVLYRLFQDALDIKFKNVLIVAASGWLVITMMGGLPFFVIAVITPTHVLDQFIPAGSDYAFSSLENFKNPLHCFFESMSAYTTTGLSMAVHEPSVGKGVLFYRSLSQWVGGAGFIVMVLAVFKQSTGRGSLLLYGSETSGQKLRPRVIETARAIWKVYITVTLFSAIYLIVGTHLILPDYPLSENIFDSINHAMAGQSTGGFSTLDDSIAGYQNVYMDMLYLLPMMLGAFSMAFYFNLIYKRKVNEFWKDIQTRYLLIAFVIGSLIQTILLMKAKSVPDSIREGTFQFISAMSTTGWQTSDIGSWDWLSIVFIVSTAMFIGGASGGTVGGIKMIRFLLIGKGLRWQINKIFLSENTIKKINFNGRSLLPEAMNEEFTKDVSFAIMFLLLVIGSSVISTFFVEGQFTMADILFESASAQGTVGLSAGITDPGMSPVLELIYIFQMWAGRLEIIPVMALIRAIIWGTEPKII